MVQRRVPIAFPSGQVAGKIAVLVPAGWSLVASTVNGALSAQDADGAGGYSWTISVGSGVTLQLTGPNTQGTALTGTITTPAGSSPVSFQLT